ncbi:MAG: 30S ribosomal protein S7 [Candidatus Dojkabacteria bacterium]|jgi:small subunit ribosomal protein S7|nr:30S ribosomal protein S7 [Candidatus Dojkabacteria bacterium]MDD4560936.1 30S ribosomal protein S7 [Candidatus Dojkabacteria bacterium]
MRGKGAKKREQKPDKKYGSVLITRLINKVMLDGKKSYAEKMVYTSLEKAVEVVKEKDVNLFFNKVIDNVRPALETRARRVGGANYQVPVPVSPRRQEALAVRWLVEGTRKKSGKSFEELLTTELIDAYKGEGDAIKKKIDTERMAEANKAFAHFRW